MAFLQFLFFFCWNLDLILLEYVFEFSEKGERVNMIDGILIFFSLLNRLKMMLGLDSGQGLGLGL